ncbi:MAG: YybH family protein [Gemmatimonadaceae bacterium]
MRNTGGFTLLAVGSLFLSGCGKTVPAMADSATALSTATTSFDENAARAQILANDSAFVRWIMAKHVDSAMVRYDPDVVALGSGKVVRGAPAVRSFYTEGLKSNPREAMLQSDGVKFSNDHSMAWDYGTFSQITDAPNGKPVKSNGTFLFVWKNVGGRWVIVAETSTAP